MPPFHSHPFQATFHFCALGASLPMIHSQAFKDLSQLPFLHQSLFEHWEDVLDNVSCCTPAVLLPQVPTCKNHFTTIICGLNHSLSLMQHIRHVLIARCYQLLERKHSEDTKTSKKNHLPQRDCTDIISSAHFYNLLC